MTACSDIMLLILAVILPPLAVILKSGCGSDLCINIILTLLAYIPGLIHAWWVILSEPHHHGVEVHHHHH